MDANLGYVEDKITEIAYSIRHAAEILAHHSSISKSLFLGQNRGVNRILNDLINVYPFFNYALIVEPDGSIFAATTKDSKGNKIEGEQLLGENISETINIAAILKSEVVSLSPGLDPFFETMGIESKMSQWFIVPVQKRGETIGWVVISYNWQQEMVSLLKILVNRLKAIGNETAELFISTEKGDIVVGSMAGWKETTFSPQKIYKEKHLIFGRVTMKLIMSSEKSEIFNPIKKIRNLQILIIIPSIFILIVFFYIVLYITILRKVKLLHASAEELNKGNLDYKLPVMGHDELGGLSKIFNQMVKNLQAIVSQANRIAKEDYSAVVVPRSEKDTLGIALQQMSGALEKQNWLKTGQTQLNDVMNGKKDTTSLSRDIISFLAGHLNAQAGIIYLRDINNRLRLEGSYALKKSKDPAPVFEFGEGLVGQAAVDKKLLIITDVPEDYMAVNSSLGDASPRNILLVPFLHEGEVKGVIELGSMDLFSEKQMYFLNLVNENIAIAFHVAQSQ
jgi:methyl-accepting chemotaxis protein